ncbi:MAG: RIP metalloprotease RseP [Flavobacteriaceae bacterium]
MDVFIKASQFILSLSLLIVLHELGHFLPAKYFKIKVEKFYLFFDYKFSLFKKKIGDTVYGIGWIPLGGYVKIAGMIDESMDTEAMKLPPKDWEFRSKPAWQRLIVMLGGVTVNFVLGILIYQMILFVWGEDYVTPEGVKNGFSTTQTFKDLGFQDGDKILQIDGEAPLDVLDINKYLFLRGIQTVQVKHTDGSLEQISIPQDIGLSMWQNNEMEPFNPRIEGRIDSVVPASIADKAGILKGDQVVSVNNTPTIYWNDFQNSVKNREGSELNLEIKRNGEIVKKQLQMQDQTSIGVYTDFDIQGALNIQHEDYSYADAFVGGNKLAYWTLHDYIAQFKYVFTKKGAQSVGGFIAIGSIFPSTWSWQSFWSITAFLSIMLGFMNLLPIPALDGGHVMFTLYEMISGRKPSDKFLEYAQMAGFFLLIALLLLANGNDIVKLFNS